MTEKACLARRFFLSLFVLAAALCLCLPADAQGATQSLAASKSTIIKKMSEDRYTLAVRAIRNVGPAIVGVANMTYVQDHYGLQQLMDKGIGSGVIFDAEQGYIVTSYHLVQGAARVTVMTADGRIVDGEVQGVDPPTDLAVIKINATGLQEARLDDSDMLIVGEPAISIGNPMGLEFGGSSAFGIISALNRAAYFDSYKIKLLQTDAALLPGNSGGALVNADGLLIGINSEWIAPIHAPGVNYAIPANTVRKVVASICRYGCFFRPSLGLVVIGARDAQRLCGRILLHGVIIDQVQPDSPASRSPLEAGDVIAAVNGQTVDRPEDIWTMLEPLEAGTVVTIAYMRDGEARETKLIVDTLVVSEAP